MSRRFRPRPPGRTIPVRRSSVDDDFSGRPCGAVGAALPLWWSLDGGGREAPTVRMRHTVRMSDHGSGQDSQPTDDGESGRVVVVTPDGMGVSTPSESGAADESGGNPADL